MKKAMALLLACSMVLAFAACSKKQHTEQEVTAVVDVTDENGKTVTDKDGKDKTEKATKKNETTTKKTTTTTTTVAANRKIHISVSLPAGTDTRTDKLRITINGKQVDEKKVTLEIGNTFTYTTEKKYRGDVKVQVELEHTKKSAKVTVKKGTDTAKFNFENIENLLGDDD